MAVTKKNTTGKSVAWVIVFLGAVLMLAPFYFTFVLATQPREAIYHIPPPMWFGEALAHNISAINALIPFWHNLGMSFYVAAMTTVLALFFCSMAGYAFAMYEFRFKKFFFAIVLGSMLLPPFLGLIPTFMLMNALGWLDQPRALYLPAAAGAFGIFLMRQYIGSAVPKELMEAARIDGCGEFRIYWNVVLPLIGPALGTLGLVTFITSWNSFLQPLVIMHTPENFTLPVALRSVQSTTNTDWGAVMAGSAIAVLPLLILFVLFSRRLIAGLTAGAVKG
ncbi:carbohydrate ABC transporter permease [Amantichitinum ursilacus]|uniref:L-arabinose transport system permease protein AraQ n=1 Tax=Amantichitinum ursilacus TaxID=857265 RepID=A0A0N0XL71_9NEIS|nr:carbohydrate ABC transporter permease [Amantichitinum ursilacus]KPC54849.1 L-arabinose transport system permease protein AraQ [Amantichitinum ursilacus]